MNQTTIRKRKRVVAIMRDVIKQLNTDKAIATAGVYCHTRYDGVQTFSKAGLLKPNAKACQVCALGAAFLGAVRKYDIFSRVDRGVTSGEMTNHLVEQGLFTAIELDVIENLFEGFYDDTPEGLRLFLRLSADTRLRIMCKLIIHAGGRISERELQRGAVAAARRLQRLQ